MTLVVGSLIDIHIVGIVLTLTLMLMLILMIVIVIRVVIRLWGNLLEAIIDDPGIGP